MQGYVVCDNFWCKEHKASHNEDQAVESRASNEQWGSESSRERKARYYFEIPKKASTKNARGKSISAALQKVLSKNALCLKSWDILIECQSFQTTSYHSVLRINTYRLKIAIDKTFSSGAV